MVAPALLCSNSRPDRPSEPRFPHQPALVPVIAQWSAEAGLLQRGAGFLKARGGGRGGGVGRPEEARLPQMEDAQKAESLDAAGTAPSAAARGLVLPPLGGSVLDSLGSGLDSGNAGEQAATSKKKKKKSVRMSFADDPPVVQGDEGGGGGALVVETLATQEEVATAETSPPSGATRKSASFSFEPLHVAAPVPVVEEFVKHDSANNDVPVVRGCGTPLAPASVSNVVANPPSTSAKNTTSSSYTAGHFRRVERLRRHLEICCDVLRGREEFRKSGTVAITLLLAWLVIPVVVIILSFGLVPYSSLTDAARSTAAWNSLWPWSVIVLVEAALMTEVFSALAYEIEFGIVVREELPALYAKVSFAGLAAALTVHSIILGCTVTAAAPDAVFYSSSLRSSRGWLAVQAAAFAASAATLHWAFSSHAGSAPSRGTLVVSAQVVAGLFVLLPCAAVLYTIVAAVHAQYHDEGRGIVGYIVAIFFPLLREGLREVAESACGWGAERGRLCATPIHTLLIESWHVSFLCLVAATNATPGELAVMAAVQLALLWRDFCLPPGAASASAAAAAAVSGEEAQSSPRANSGSKACWAAGLCSSPDSKIDIYADPEAAATSVQSVDDEGPQSSAYSGTARADDMGCGAKAVVSFCCERLLGRTSGSDEGGVKGKADLSSEDSFEVDSEQLRRAVRLVLSSALGTLAPCVVLAASAVLAAGPNRLLLSRGPLWGLAVATGPWAEAAGSAQWLRSPLVSVSGGGGDGGGGDANRMTANLLCVAGFHAAVLLAAAKTLGGRHCHVLGAFSSVVLTHHTVTFAASALLALLTLFSVVLGVFGMNTPF